MQLDEYIDLFGLSEADRCGHILEYGHVPMTEVVSWDGFSQPVTRCAEHHGALPFNDFTFDLALWPDAELQLQPICELARVAKEVRLFPLINHLGLPSPLLGPLLLGLQQENYGVEVRDVTTLLHPEGNAMLRVWAQQCHVS